MAISEALTVTPVELTARDDVGISTLFSVILFKVGEEIV